MAAPGWPKAETIPEASVVQIDADGSHHGSRHGSHHGSRHGSQNGSLQGPNNYMQALQVSRESGSAAKLDRRPSRRLENAMLGVNDFDQDYADDYPTDQDNQAQDGVDEKTKARTYGPWQLVKAYFKKWIGGVDEAMPVPPVLDMLICYLGAFLGILWVAGCAKALDQQLHEHILVASLGATAVLLYGVMESKLAQPRNVIGGHVVSAAVGCAFRLALADATWVAAPLSMATAMLAMQWTRTTHPPGGATAIIASQVSPLPPWAGFSFIIVVLAASSGMVAIALITNNLHYKKRYPTYWFGYRKPTWGVSWH